MRKRIAITADCVCDLADNMLDAYKVKVIYFYITTDTGCFKDMDEMTSNNVVEYLAGGGQYISTDAPKAEEYEELFRDVLKNHDEVIHITITSCLSKSYITALQAAEKFEGKIHVFDTGLLSTGIGHLVIKAVEMVREGKGVEEILNTLSEKKDKVSTTFIAGSVDYLYRNGRISKFIKVMSTTFKIHPVLEVKNGQLKLKSIEIGNYEKSVLRYVRKQLKDADKIEKTRLFVTHANCSVKMISQVKKMAVLQCPFEEIYVTNASATITSNCGSNTLGVLFVNE